MTNFMELSFTFIMDLYRSKVRAERDKDVSAIASLNLHYPELFSSEFAEFIENAKLATLCLDQKYDQNFSTIFEPTEKEKIGNLH